MCKQFPTAEWQNSFEASNMSEEFKLIINPNVINFNNLQQNDKHIN